MAQLVRPGRDPREDLPPPVFKQGVLKLEDLTPGMELTGTILNVVDFGAFVDIGVHHSGLIHVSQLADKYIRDPHDMVAVGDIVKVWVLEVDKHAAAGIADHDSAGHAADDGRHERQPEANQKPAKRGAPRPRRPGDQSRKVGARADRGGRPPFQQRAPRPHSPRGPGSGSEATRPPGPPPPKPKRPWCRSAKR